MTVQSVGSILKDYEQGRVSKGYVMGRLRLTHYGDLLRIMSDNRLTPPLGGYYASPGAVEFVSTLLKKPDCSVCPG